MSLKQPIASTSNLSCLLHVKSRQTPVLITSCLRARAYSTQNASRRERHSDAPSTVLTERRASALGLGTRKPRSFNAPSSSCYSTSTTPSTPYLQLSLSYDPNPSGPKFSFNLNDEPKGEDIPDNEWELRTGRAIYVLQTTLPSFFETGLVTRVDVTTGEPKPPSQHSHFHIPGILDSAAALDFLSSSTSTSNDQGHHSDGSGGAKTEREDEENIYSPSVRLQYTPPAALPAPFPKTFHLEGFPLYIASSSLVRRTMIALYTDLEVTLIKMKVFTEPPPPPDSQGGGGYANASASANASSLPPNTFSVHLSPAHGGTIVLGTGASLPVNEDEHRSGAEEERPSRKVEKKRRAGRDKYVVVRQLVTGTNRVSGKVGEWEVESMYTFSPTSGLILQHTVNSIQPTPHLAVYDLLRGSLGQVFGFGGGGGRIGGEGVGGIRM